MEEELLHQINTVHHAMGLTCIERRHQTAGAQELCCTRSGVMGSRLGGERSLTEAGQSPL